MSGQHWSGTREETCQKHGHFVSSNFYSDRWSRCPVCTEQARAEREEADRKERRASSIVRFLGECDSPALYAAACLGDLVPELRQKVTAWVEKAAAGGDSLGPLVLVGGVGTGKTHAACAVLRHGITLTAAHGLYITAAAYSRAIRSTWGKGSTREDEILANYARSSWLVLDDLGAGQPKDIELVQDLISERYAAGRMKRTIIATNIAAKGFDQAFGDRAADRIRHGATLVNVLGKSWRKPA